MALLLTPALRLKARQLVRPVDGLQRGQAVVTETEVRGASAGGAGGGGAGGHAGHAGPAAAGGAQLHAAGVVAGQRPTSCSCSFPDALHGHCTGHLSGGLEQIDRSNMLK